MQLTDTNISDFQKLYKELYDIELTKEIAYEKGLRILNLVKLIYKPMSKAEFAKIRHHLKDWKSEIAELEALGKC